jgi:glucose-1-phosphate adenylyltransferase
VEDAMVSGGCVIDRSNLERSLLYSNVKVGEGCDLQGVLALPGCEIGAGCRLKHVILDNGCIVPDGTVIGEDSRKDKQRFDITEHGVVVVNRKMLGQEAGYQTTFGTDG